MTTSAHQVVRSLGERHLLDLVAAVCRARGVTLDEICGRQRTRAVAQARHEVWWRLRHYDERYDSLEEIGRLFGRDHTTVLHGVEAHGRRVPVAQRDRCGR